MGGLLTDSEIDLLLQRREMSKKQQRNIRHKLNKKLREFYGIEQPLLVDKGYVNNLAAAMGGGGVAMGGDGQKNIGRTVRSSIADFRVESCNNN